MRHRFAAHRFTARRFTARRFAASWLAPLALVLPPHATASGDMRPAFLSFVSRACIHQDPAHRSSAFGKRLEASADFAGWDKFSATPVARCLRERRWVPAALCASAAQVDITQRAQLNDWFEAHMDDAKKLAPVFRFVNSQDAAAGSCPQIQPGE